MAAAGEVWDLEQGIKKEKSRKISLKAKFWCGREDSNLHALRR